jgi:hypothetical protein
MKMQAALRLLPGQAVQFYNGLTWVDGVVADLPCQIKFKNTNRIVVFVEVDGQRLPATHLSLKCRQDQGERTDGTGGLRWAEAR